MAVGYLKVIFIVGENLEIQKILAHDDDPWKFSRLMRYFDSKIMYSASVIAVFDDEALFILKNKLGGVRDQKVNLWSIYHDQKCRGLNIPQIIRLFNE